MVLTSGEDYRRRVKAYCEGDASEKSRIPTLFGEQKPNASIC
jgi:hypothetical protein